MSEMDRRTFVGNAAGAFAGALLVAGCKEAPKVCCQRAHKCGWDLSGQGAVGRN